MPGRDTGQPGAGIEEEVFPRELGKGDLRANGKTMAARDDEKLRAAPERDFFDARITRFLIAAHKEVDPTFQNIGPDRVVRQRYMHIQVFGVQFRDQVDQAAGKRKARDGEIQIQVVIQSGTLAEPDGGKIIPNDITAVGNETLAGVGQNHVAGAALEQPLTDLLLKFGKTHTEDSGGDTKLVGGLGKAAKVGNGIEFYQSVQIHNSRLCFLQNSA